MSSFSLALVVLAAIIHATWNLLSKHAAVGGVAFVFTYNLVASVAYLPWVLWILIHNVHNEVTWSLSAAVCITISAAIHLAYSLCLQRGYQVADLSVVYPIARGTGPMLSSIGAFLLLQETPSTHGVLGLIAVVTGIGLIATQGDFSAFRRPRGQQGVAWGAATGGLIASYTVVDGYGVKVLGIHPVLLDWFSNLVRFFMLVPLVMARRARMKDAMKGKWLLAVGVGVLSPMSYILVLTAVQLGAPLSLVAPAREMSMMIGAMFGMVLLREPVSAWRIIGCLVLCAGVVLLGSS
jgi:drug/metabolite transporter (DMT)-like permease